MASPKERLMHELKELTAIVSYLAVSFSLIATGKSLILIQVGINDFVHSYITALIESLALGKIVVLTQNISLLKKMDHTPILRATAYKAIVMAIIVFLGGQVEEKIFAKHVADAAMKERVLFAAAHIFGLFIVFYTLFVARGLDKALGKGMLWKILSQRDPADGPILGEPATEGSAEH